MLACSDDVTEYGAVYGAVSVETVSHSDVSLSAVVAHAHCQGCRVGVGVGVRVRVSG